MVVNVDAGRGVDLGQSGAAEARAGQEQALIEAAHPLNTGQLADGFAGSRLRQDESRTAGAADGYRG